MSQEQRNIGEISYKQVRRFTSDELEVCMWIEKSNKQELAEPDRCENIDLVRSKIAAVESAAHGDLVLGINLGGG